MNVSIIHGSAGSCLQEHLLLTSPLARAYSVMPFVWSIGTIIGPAIGGTFADPSSSFPDIFPEDGLFGRFPYLLPNLICAGLLMISIILGYFLLEETHPDMQPRVSLPDSTYVSDETPLIATADAIKKPAVDLRADTYGTFEGSDDTAWRNQDHMKPKRGSNPKPQIWTKQVLALIVALGLFTYHSMTYDHLLPIFLEDDRLPSILSLSSSSTPSLLSFPNPFSSPGGLGLSIHAVGLIMSVNGIIALLVQAIVFPFAATCLGIHRLFLLVTILHPLAYVIMPFLLYLPPGLLYPGIYFCLTVRNLLGILAYPVLLILLKEATPSPCVLGRINGLAASAGAACRTVAPPVAGYLYTLGRSMGCTGLAWWGSALVAAIGVVQCFQVQRQKAAVDVEEAAKKNTFQGN